MTRQTEIAREIERTGYVVLPGRLNGHALGAARAGLGSLLGAAGWGSAGFDGTRTKRVWAPPYLGFINGRHPRDWLMGN